MLARPRLKALLGLGTLLAAAVAVSGCATSRADGGRPQVLTTFTVIADMVEQVGGGRVEVRSLTKPGAEIHGYEPTPSDLKRAARADLVLDNGLGLERWFAQFVDRSDATSRTLTEGIRPIAIAGESDDAGKANPHAWVSTKNAVVYVENIRKALTELDPAGAPVYRRNADRYSARLRAIGQRVESALRALPPSRRALVSCEGAFSYIARDLGLTEGYLWPVNADQQGTPQQIKGTVELVRDRDVPAVFCESTVSPEPMERVAAESGARFGGTLYVDSLSEEDGPVPTYEQLLERDAATIVAGLTGAAR